ncbi:MAG: NosD domain-containing protein [Candidatus Thorarchaeota archaeon]
MILVIISDKGAIHPNIDATLNGSDLIDPNIKNVTPKTSQLRSIFCTGNFSDEGKDLDGDLLYDQIVLYVEIEVNRIFPNFTITIYFQPQMADGTEINGLLDVSQSFRWKDLGIHNLSISLINASRFHNLGQTIKFHIQRVQIARIHEISLMPELISIQYNLYTTRLYSNENFDLFIQLIGQFWDRVEDTDFNWRYDYLIVEFTIEVLQVSRYTISLTLEPEMRSGEKLTGKNMNNFEEGVNIVSIFFDAGSVRRLKVNGSLLVTELQISESDNIVYRTNPDYLTQKYFYTEFDIHSLEISNNKDFKTFMTDEKLPGDGSPLDPYIISGFIMTDPGTQECYINIKNVDFFFHITNNILSNGKTAIFLENVSHCLVAHNDLRKNQFGIRFKDAFACNIEHNSIINHNVGLSLYNVSNTVVNSNIFGRDTKSIITDRSRNNMIVNNTFSGKKRNIEDIGLYIGLDSDNNLVLHNDFQDNSINAIDLGSNNVFQSNYWKDWIGEGYYWIPDEEDLAKNYDLSPLIMPNHIVGPTIISPSRGTYLDSNIEINWIAYDTMGPSLTYDIYLFIENELFYGNWSLLVSGLTRNHFKWDVHNITNGIYRIKIVAYDSFGFSRWKISDTINVQTPINLAPTVHPLLGIIILVIICLTLIKFA